MQRSSLVFAFFVALILFALAVILQDVISTPDKDFKLVELFQAYPGLIVAMAAGYLGATFSMLIGSRKWPSQATLEDLSAASSWTTLTVRASVGLGAAAVLYFFFESGLLEGSLWPKLDELKFLPMVGSKSPALVVPNQHWCLLIVWCFIAGFSETLVPNILTQTESRSGGASAAQ